VFDDTNRLAGFAKTYDIIWNTNSHTSFRSPTYYFDYSHTSNIETSGLYDLVLYSGRRWCLVQVNQDLFEMIVTSATFHMSWDDYLLYNQCKFQSEPTTSMSPINLKWYRTAQDKSGLGTTMEATTISIVCAQCSYSSDLSLPASCYNGKCNATSQSCDCLHGWIGKQCQIPPIQGEVKVILELDSSDEICVICPTSSFILDQSNNIWKTQTKVVLEGLFHYDLAIEWLEGITLAVALRVENEIGLPREIFNAKELGGLAKNVHVQKILEISVDKNSIPFLAFVKEDAVSGRCSNYIQDMGGEICGQLQLDKDETKSQSVNFSRIWYQVNAQVGLA